MIQFCVMTYGLTQSSSLYKIYIIAFFVFPGKSNPIRIYCRVAPLMTTQGNHWGSLRSLRHQYGCRCPGANRRYTISNHNAVSSMTTDYDNSRYHITQNTHTHIYIYIYIYMYIYIVITIKTNNLMLRWDPFQYNDALSRYKISIIKIRRSWDPLI